MEKASLYNVDSNRPATAKQCYAVGRHFAKIHASTPSGAFRLSKVFAAILLKFNAEHSETPITHGDITRFFELDAVPQKFLERIAVRAPKTSTKSTKTVAEPSKKVIKAKKTTTQPKVEKETVKASTQSVEDFKARLEAIDARFNKVEATVESHGKKLASMDAKLDILMAWLETNPEL
jgi:hypothetical protein